MTANTYRSASDFAELRARTRTLAKANGGLFTRADLARWDMDPTITTAMVRRHHWAKLRHGIYIDTADLAVASANEGARHLLDARAAVMVMHEPAFAFARTGAVAHGLPLPGGPIGAVALVRHTGRDLRAAHRRLTSTEGLPEVAMKCHDLSDIDTTLVSGLPCVSRDLAAFTAAATYGLEWAVCLLDAAAWQAPSALTAYERFIDEWSCLRGVGTLRRAVPMTRCGAQSPFESLSRVRLMSRGLPEPSLQHPFYDADGLIGYADMYWEEWGVVGECDGLAKYRNRNDLIAEKRREDRLRALGLVVVRWTWAELMHSPALVAQRILTAVNRATHRTG